ncbi:PQQ-dependent sugar dehydrogenase [Hyalangium rubrum]|uniref:PQQ-dependent sugar dehydrogenase n=1 Tax=Hyalangium rubrum TaxID=3103134 RepID=A0ABU5GZ02_9BACT|nr:PQQ-dependent sugar dehydrogenase [Hyalangium sp. s54d21]MDY7226104.1 PQQ-dependent sugar dehydrogenase [Hyalangium sp. s54d21]
MTRQFPPAVLVVTVCAVLSLPSCSDEKPPEPVPIPTPSPYGLDERPANPTCLARERPVENTGVTTQPVFPALRFSQPLFVLQAPEDDRRVFVVQRGGIVRVFPNDNAVTAATSFVDITSRVNSAAGSEAGLLGMAFHPRFATNGEVFLSYTGFGGPTNLRSVISRFKSSDGGATLDPASEQILLTVDQPYSNHNGGGIAFGPDGYLYIGMGDGGSGGDPQNYAQNLNSLLGKFLRIDVDGGSPYAIPATNPFRNGGGKPEIYAWGLRNPWRWSFDRATGELWAGDVGQNALEEVDRIVLGGNYGWRIKEADQCFNAATCSSAGLIDPIVKYPRSEGVSITGGYVYRGRAIPALVGRFIYGDFATGILWAVSYDAVTGEAAPQLLVDTSVALSSFGEMVDGEVLITDFSSGRLHKLVPSGPQAPVSFPQKLSETGCVEPTNPQKPASGLIPYDVNAPLWSDGAQKERFLALPDGKQIRVGDDGDWELPVGSVLVKTFFLGDKRVETRLFMRHPDGSWGGYSYEWDDAQTDATLLPASKSRQVGDQTWYFPSRAECVRCHTSAAGHSLGLETGQLNRDLVYASTQRVSNQLTTLEHVGLFEAGAGGVPSALSRYPTPMGSDALELRARAYLHSNCSNCHRPNSTGRGPADLRFSTPLAQTKVCDATPEQGSLGVADAKLLAPGAPERSLLSLRLHALDANRMPPLASRVIDTEGVGVVNAWISSLTGCP